MNQPSRMHEIPASSIFEDPEQLYGEWNIGNRVKKENEWALSNIMEGKKRHIKYLIPSIKEIISYLLDELDNPEFTYSQEKLFESKIKMIEESTIEDDMFNLSPIFLEDDVIHKSQIESIQAFFPKQRTRKSLELLREPFLSANNICLHCRSLGFHGTNDQMIGTPCVLGALPQSYFSDIGKIMTFGKQVKQMNTTGNRFSVDTESRLVIDIYFMDYGKISSHLHDNFSHCNPQKHKETMPRSPMDKLNDTFTHFNQHKRKETMKSVSSFVATMSFLFCLLSTNYSHPLLKEHETLSIGFSLLGLFSFLVFVWAVFTMVLVGAQFTWIQSTTLLVWVIILTVRSAGSITTAYVPILGIFLVGWFARSKATHQMKGNK